MQFLRAFLNCDPYGDELREQVYEQSKLVDEIENPHIEMDQNGKPKSEVVQKVRQIREKRETKFQEIMDKKGKKRIHLRREQQEAIREQVEHEIWTNNDIDKLKLLEREKDALRHLKTIYAAYIQSTDIVRTTLASEVAKEGIEYCSRQITKENVLEPVLVRSVTDSLARATELLTFMPEKGLVELIEDRKYTNIPSYNLHTLVNLLQKVLLLVLWYNNYIPV